MDEIGYNMFKNRSYILTRNEKVIDVGDAFFRIDWLY